MKKILAAVAVISALTLTGCGNIDTAATFGSKTITQAQAQEKVDEILAARNQVDTSQMQLETGEALNRGQLRFKILMHTFDEIAKELKLEVTASEIAAKKAAIIESVGGEAELLKNLVNAAIAERDFDTYVRAIVISDQVAAALTASGVAETEVSTRVGELLNAKAKTLGVTINPRYGVWDNEAGDVVAGQVTGDAVVPSNK